MSTIAEVQKGIYGALTAMSPALSVYDDVPQDEPPLYIIIGDDTGTPSDTKEGNAIEHRVQIHVWSSYPGYKEVKQTLDSIYATLHRQQITVAGADSTELQFVLSDVLDDPSGLRHGVITFRFQTY